MNYTGNVRSPKPVTCLHPKPPKPPTCPAQHVQLCTSERPVDPYVRRSGRSLHELRRVDGRVSEAGWFWGWLDESRPDLEGGEDRAGVHFDGILTHLK